MPTYSVPAITQAWTAGPEGVRGDVSLYASGLVQFRVNPPLWYAHAEGAKLPDYQPAERRPLDEDLEPARPADTPVANCRAFSLVMLVVPSGQAPPAFTLDGSVVNGVQLDRETNLFTIEELQTVAGTSGAVDLYFAFNDIAYEDNAGAFTVTVVEDKTSDVFRRDLPYDLDDAQAGRRCAKSGFYYAGHGLRWQAGTPVGRDFYKEDY